MKPLVDEAISNRILNALSRTEPMLVPEIHYRINRDPRVNPHVDHTVTLMATRLLVDEGRAERVPPFGYIRTGPRP